MITKDLIRNVIVPSKDPSGQSIVLRRHNLNRIKSASKVKSQSEIEREAMRRQQEKGTLILGFQDCDKLLIILFFRRQGNRGCRS